MNISYVFAKVNLKATAITTGGSKAATPMIAPHTISNRATINESDIKLNAYKMTPVKARYIKTEDGSKPVRHINYEHTISGLLHKRVDLFHEAERIRDRLAEIKNDLDSLDRTLGVLGYEGDLDAAMPRQKRHVIFGKGELTKQVLTILRRSDNPMTSRQIAQEIVSDSGLDAKDRKYVSDLTKRVGKACRQYPEGTIKKATDERGNVVWGV